jgi:hypothetical protein
MFHHAHRAASPLRPVVRLSFFRLLLPNVCARPLGSLSRRDAICADAAWRGSVLSHARKSLSRINERRTPGRTVSGGAAPLASSRFAVRWLMPVNSAHAGTSIRRSSSGRRSPSSGVARTAAGVRLGCLNMGLPPRIFAPESRALFSRIARPFWPGPEEDARGVVDPPSR